MSINAVPVHNLRAIGFRDTTGGMSNRCWQIDGREVYTMILREGMSGETLNYDKVLPHAWLLESASNLTNPGLGETGETKTDAATSESSRIPLRCSSSKCSAAQPDDIRREIQEELIQQHSQWNNLGG